MNYTLYNRYIISALEARNRGILLSHHTGVNDEEGVYRCMERILSSPDMPTAVCCMSDMQAIQGIRYCQEKGLHI